MLDKREFFVEPGEAEVMALDGVCPDCRGDMEWCDCCQMWSQICCVDYGTCECS